MTITVLMTREGPAGALDHVDGITVRTLDRDTALDTATPLDPEHAAARVLVPVDIPGDVAAPLLERLPELALIQLPYAGAESWIGRVPSGVALNTCRGAHGGSTSEWVMAALLDIYRELPAFAAARAARTWDRRATDTLQGKRVLVVGAGDLGNQLARRLAAFDAHPTLVGRRARDGVHGIDELPALLPGHDATVLMVPLTPATTGLADAAFLAAMPDGAVLVNAARGPVVDTVALLAELSAGRLRAALDVTDPEPLPADHPLWSAPNLLLTPHVGGHVTGAGRRAMRVIADELTRYVAGEPLRNLVGDAY